MQKIIQAKKLVFKLKVATKDSINLVDLKTQYKLCVSSISVYLRSDKTQENLVKVLMDLKEELLASYRHLKVKK